MSSTAPQPSTERASASPPRSRSPSPALQLDPSTLAALSAFYDEQAEAERQFQELEKKAHERLEKAREGDAAAADDRMMSVDEFRTLMKEDWQLSQFWYSADFASRFARFLYAHCTSSTRIAFLSCPTAYVGFQHENPLREAFLFEYDARFGLVAGDKFVKYDLEEPLESPEALKGKVDIAIADPPFLNETTNRYFAETLNALLRPEGKLVLLTSTSTRPFLPSVYTSPPAGPLHRTDFRVEHAGSRLQNEFGVWTSWEWEGEVEGVRCEGREEGA